MSTLSQFVGGRRNVAQLFGQTVGMVLPGTVHGARAVSVPFNAVPQPVLTITGRGALNLVAIRASLGNSSSFGLRVTIDGRQIFNISVSLSETQGVCAIGSIDAMGASFAPQPVVFVTSALVEANYSSGGGASPLVFLNYEVDV